MRLTGWLFSLMVIRIRYSRTRPAQTKKTRMLERLKENTRAFIAINSVPQWIPIASDGPPR